MTSDEAGAPTHGHHRPSGTLPLAGATAIAVADALDRLAGLPSTPGPVADEAAATAGEISQVIAAAGRHPAEVEVPACCVVSAAGLLTLVGVMPSTPPAVAADAEARAAELWGLLPGATDAPDAG